MSVCLPGNSRGKSRRARFLRSISVGMAILFALPTGAAPLPAPASGAVDFAETIYPILEKNCFGCHGPAKQRGGLRLDYRAGIGKGGDSGAAIVPGDSAGSLLIQAVAGIHSDLHMPPEGQPLTAKQISLLRAWIDQGAVWPDDALGAADEPPSGRHWAFEPVTHPTPPEVNNTDWPRNEIDRFVLAKLEKKGLLPSPEAEKAVLVRRLYLDLIGLPPSPEEVDTFLADESPHAYERLVNRLLASPHFGERWGRHWLDLARYADSDGYEKDLPRPHAWRYREWVIDAINRDMPYDQFVIEQLAGDLLPHATLEQRVATGFHRNTLTNREGGVDPEEFRIEAVVDRTNTTGLVFLGLTMGCAQCHDHKYDPVSQKEYYSLFAFFNTGAEEDIPAPLAPEIEGYKQAKRRHDQARGPLQKAIDTYLPELAKSLPEWEAAQDLSDAEWHTLEPASFLSVGGARFERLDDGSLLVTGNNPTRDRYTVAAGTETAAITAFRLDALPDESLPAKGPGRAPDGAFVLTDFKLKVARDDDPRAEAEAPIQSAWADFEQADFPIENAYDGDNESGWGIGPAAGEAHAAVFIAKEDVGFSNGSILLFELGFDRSGQFSLGRFRLSYTTSPRQAVALPDAIRAILRTPAGERTEEQKNRLLNYYARFDAKYRELEAALRAHDKAAPQPPDTKAQTLAENPNPPKTHVHIRGDFLQKGEEVMPGTPAILPPLKPRGEKADRLDLARWLVAPENPLTARVAVNRVWESLFDRGIVYTSNDWGTRGDRPSHPELLDWLARRYIEDGWSRKNLIRLIVTSATYRQSSNYREDLHDIDPLNVWLARQSRFRVEAEIVRDLFLASSGLMNDTVGGPSVRPPIQPGVIELGYANSIKWPVSEGEDKYKRGMYVHFQRAVPYPSLMTFDCPDSNRSCVRRTRSNTPLQALTLLNDPVFFECAQALAGRVLKEGPAEKRERVRFVFRTCLGRQPNEAELEALVALLDDQLARFREDTGAAAGLANAHTVENVAVEESAAYIILARSIMNLDEFVTRE